MKQVVGWVVLVSQDVMHSLQTTGGVGGAILSESGPNDFPRCFYHPLECLLFSLGAAGEPYEESICQNTADGTVVKVHHQLFRDLGIPQFSQVVKALLSLSYR